MNDSRQSNADVAVSRLRALIFDGRLPAGSDHLESELAAILGMSRTPVREAALTLQAQGLVVVRPRRGIRILPLAPADIAEIYDVLTALESMAAADAATKGYTATDLSALSTCIDAMDSALATEDRPAWAAADDAFHTELVRLGGNARVVSITAMMADQVRRARAVTLFLRPLPLQSNDDHRQVLQAIAAGDAERAHAVHLSHLRTARAMLLDLLGRHHLQQL